MPSATIVPAATTPVPLPLDGRRRSLPFRVGAVLLASLFLAACSWVEVPMVPVPMTMQTFGLVLLGALCGWRLALGASLAYLAEGAAGLPVFAGGAAGAHHLVGPTGGYLAAFPLAAALVGWLAERGWTTGLARSFAAMLLGHAVVLGLGAAYLAAQVGPEKAVAFGLTPFLLGSVLKSALAVATVELARRRRAAPAVVRPRR
jgi:biotin transport system substrate-specific component